MNIEVSRVEVDVITPLRELHRQALQCQIMHDSFPRRGFSDGYLIRVDGNTAGYGLVANRHWPETVHEFYLIPAFQGSAQRLFRELLEVSQATKVLAQTNDRLQTIMLYDSTTNITAEAILFDAGVTSHLPSPGGELRPVTAEDKPWLEAQKLDADSAWMIECEGVPVATGGALFHYNPPFGDLYMAVHEGHRRRGFGSYMIQELKRICYEMGKIPAARCNISNVASRRTMEKAGMRPCCRLLVGEVVK